MPDRAAGEVDTGHTSTPVSVWLLLTLVVLVGAYLRIVGTLDVVVTHPVYSDARDYWVYGINLNKSGIFSREVQRPEEDEKPSPDAVRAPGYPAVIALLMRMLPERHWYRGMIWLQIVLGVGIIGLTFRLFSFLLPPAWALVPVALVAVSPHLIMLGAYLLSEVLFTFALLLVFLLVRRHTGRPTAGNAFLTGTFVGLGTLIRAGLQYYSVILALFYLANAPRDNRVQIGAAVMLGFVIIIGAGGFATLP